MDLLVCDWLMKLLCPNRPLDANTDRESMWTCECVSCLVVKTSLGISEHRQQQMRAVEHQSSHERSSLHLLFLHLLISAHPPPCSFSTQSLFAPLHSLLFSPVALWGSRYFFDGFSHFHKATTFCRKTVKQVSHREKGVRVGERRRDKGKDEERGSKS